MKALLDHLTWSITIMIFFTTSVTLCQTTFQQKPHDNHKPHFRNCKDYRPVVKEGEPDDTFVIQVKAYDPDEHDEILYDLNNWEQFRINPNTGAIYTTYTFDRDHPLNEKEVFLTVKAMDNGNPPLHDHCTIKIIIEDVNDCPPIFDRSSYRSFMSEYAQVNTTVMQISASDFDVGDNSIIRYEILPERSYKHFRIDEKLGLIFLNHPIRKVPGEAYVINVRAFNIIEGYPQEARIIVRIRIIESNKNPPEFLIPIVHSFTLKEDSRDFFSPLIKLEARSNVPNEPDVNFELITGTTPITNSLKTFVCKQNGNRAMIHLNESLDYENITNYILTVRVRNTYGLSVENVIKVNVKDVNDNKPFFPDRDSAIILENEPIGTPVKYTRAFDKDGTEANNMIRYELRYNTEYFAIDPLNGTVTSKIKFDKEETDFYFIPVIVSDNSPSSLLDNGEPNRESHDFIVHVEDKNDHKPNFKQNEYIVDNLPQNTFINALVIQVKAIDRDKAAQFVYTIEEGNVENAFKIDPLNGKIRVNKPLDFETAPDYRLTIKANDGIYDCYATVMIRIENVNDSPSVFKKNS